MPKDLRELSVMRLARRIMNLSLLLFSVSAPPLSECQSRPSGNLVSWRIQANTVLSLCFHIFVLSRLHKRSFNLDWLPNMRASKDHLIK